MNQLQIFNFNKNEVRTVLIDGDVWFVGKDIAELLGYSNYRDAIDRHVAENDRITLTSRNTTIDNIPNRGLIGVNESGTYALIFGSKLPEAKEIKHWVTSEILPTIRKHGAYMTPETIEKTLTNPDFIIGLATELKKAQVENKKLIQDNELMKPKVLFADAVATSHTSILIGDLAKLIKQNGIDIGQNRLFEELRRDGYLIKRKGVSFNQPTQKAMELKLFEVKIRTITNADGSTRTTNTTKVTGKGQLYFINRYLEGCNARQ